MGLEPHPKEVIIQVAGSVCHLDWISNIGSITIDKEKRRMM